MYSGGSRHYTRDLSIRLSASGFKRQTRASFRGKVTWTIEVDGYGWSYAAVTKRKVRSVAFDTLAP